jgi:hypothetical protein
MCTFRIIKVLEIRKPASHQADLFSYFCEVKSKTLLNIKTYFVRITLGLSEARGKALRAGFEAQSSLFV